MHEFRIQKLVWDKANKVIQEHVTAHAGDSNGRILQVQILDNGNKVDLSNTTLSLSWKALSKDKKDGLDAFTLTDQESGIFETYFTREMLSSVGVLKGSLVLVDLVGRVESDKFNILVESSNVSDEAIQSSNEFTTLTKALIRVEEVERDYQQAEQARDGLYTQAELIRDNQHTEAEISRNNLYSSAETERNTSYSNAESTRTNDYTTAESNRDILYTQAESSREENFNQVKNDFIAETERVEEIYPTRLTKIESDLSTHKEEYASLFTTNPDAKNSIYRGKYLGSSVTTEQYQAISSGTFTDLYIGDYWTINGINWRIAAFNYYRNTGDSLVPGSHITLVPDTQLYTRIMNDTNITAGGYTGSRMYMEGLEQAKTTIRGIFGAHLVKHRQILSNATVDGKASGWAWLDSEVELMNEIMVYGASVFGAGNLGGGSGHNIGVGKSQLPLFRLNPRMINTRQYYWLRDVVSATYFAFVYSTGHASFSGASVALGVRPAFSIS